MTAYDFTDKTKSYFHNAPDKTQEEGFQYVMRQIVDFAKQNLSASDTATVLDVPAGTWVLGVAFRTITADASAQIEILLDSTSLITASAANVASANTVIASAQSSPAYASSAGHIKIKAEAALDTLKGEVIVLCAKALSAF
jgi:phosphoserine aminotransferase